GGEPPWLYEGTETAVVENFGRRAVTFVSVTICSAEPPPLADSTKYSGPPLAAPCIRAGVRVNSEVSSCRDITPPLLLSVMTWTFVKVLSRNPPNMFPSRKYASAL